MNFEYPPSCSSCMRILFQVVSDAAEIVRGVIELVGGIVVELVGDLVTAALRLLVRVIIWSLVVMLLSWVYGLIFHRTLFFHFPPL